MDKNYVKKELMKSKVNATFDRYCSGNLYYRVKIDKDVYEFPIPTVEEVVFFDAMDGETTHHRLSSDLGTTDFNNEMRASLLNRWIGKAIDNDEFIRVEVAVSPI